MAEKLPRPDPNHTCVVCKYDVLTDEPLVYYFVCYSCRRKLYAKYLEAPLNHYRVEGYGPLGA